MPRRKNPLLHIRPRPPILSLRSAQQIKKQVLSQKVVDPRAARTQRMTGHDPQGRLVVCRQGDAEEIIQVLGDFRLS